MLKEKKLINRKFLKLKILGTGEIKNKIIISAHFASKQALSKIEKAGGKISIVKNKRLCLAKQSILLVLLVKQRI